MDWEAFQCRLCLSGDSRCRYPPPPSVGSVYLETLSGGGTTVALPNGAQIGLKCLPGSSLTTKGIGAWTCLPGTHGVPPLLTPQTSFDMLQRLGTLFRRLFQHCEYICLLWFECYFPNHVYGFSGLPQVLCGVLGSRNVCCYICFQFWGDMHSWVWLVAKDAISGSLVAGMRTPEAQDNYAGFLLIPTCDRIKLQGTRNLSSSSAQDSTSICPYVLYSDFQMRCLQSYLVPQGRA